MEAVGSASIAAVVLAAGAGTRFGGGKVRAPLDGRPLLAHVLAAARGAGMARVVVVLGRDAGDVRAALLADDRQSLDGVNWAINAAPERGMATSLRLGLAVARAEPAPGGILVLLGDQPRVRPEVLAALVAAATSARPGSLAVAPRYADDATPNPVLLLPPAWPLAASVEGDRGVGPLLAAEPGRVVLVPVPGGNPDVDTPQDLVALAATTAHEEAVP